MAPLSSWLHRPALPLAVGAAVALGFATIGAAVLGAGHPHEDAFILFRYVDHLAAGQGIVFNPGGPRAEGATDFLWLLLLAGLRRLGVDAAYAALAANALGAGLAAACATVLLSGGGAGGAAKRVAEEAPGRAAEDGMLTASEARWRVVGIAVAVPSLWVYHGALAAYGGFSSMLYPALCAGLVFLGAAGQRRPLLAVPPLAVVVALMRPDGVIVGVCAVIVGFLCARRAGCRDAYAKWAGGALALGSLYFAWRWSYFGLPLPLPLYVKSVPTSAGRLPGLAETAGWLVTPEVWLPALAVAWLCWSEGLRRSDAGRWGMWLVPSLALVVALCFGHQSQNVHHRFQAPATLALWLAALALVSRRLASGLQRERWIAMALLVAVSAAPWVVGGAELWRLLDNRHRTYLDGFAPELGQLLSPKDRVVLTEAGRVPYWSNAEFIDAVGLNTPSVALAPLTLRDLDTLEPVLVMFHQADTLDLTAQASEPGGDEPLLPLTAERLTAALRPEFAARFRYLPVRYRDGQLPTTQVAALVLHHWLGTRADYRVYGADTWGNGSYRHVWAFRDDWPGRAAAVEALERALRFERYRSYRALRRSRGD